MSHSSRIRELKRAGSTGKAFAAGMCACRRARCACPDACAKFSVALHFAQRQGRVMPVPLTKCGLPRRAVPGVSLTAHAMGCKAGHRL